MKRLLITTVIVLAFLTGVSVAAPHAYANANDTVTGTIGPQPAIDAAAAEAAAKTTSDLAPGSEDAYDSVMMKIMSLFAWLVGVAAMTLDYAVYYTVVAMGSYIKGISAIGVTWEVLRDIGNILLIFGFLAIGISVILNTERLGYGKKMLPMLLVAAVFINFSLFFAEAIIDTGNLFATQFYKQINGGQLPQVLPSGAIANPAGTGALTPGTEAISNKLMSVLGLQAIYGNASKPDSAKTLLKAGSPWYVGFLGILLFIITAFVMFSLAFILIARFVILIFLIILAPIGFAGLAVPKLSSIAHKWWSQLFSQTITAPVLLLMLYIALRVITDVKFLTGLGVENTNAITGVIEISNLPGFAGYILSFLVAMGLLIAVTLTAKSISAFGAGAAMKGAGALSFGATAWGMRSTVGSVGNLLASKRMQSWARRSGVGGAALKTAVSAGKGLRSRTFDVRNLPGAGGLSALGIDAGKASQLTAKQVHDTQYGVKPVKEWLQHGKEERDAAGQEIDLQNAIADVTSGRITQAAFDARFGSEISKMSVKELEQLKGIKQGTEALVKNLSPQQFEALMKSDKLDDEAKGHIKGARYSPLSSAVAAGSVPDIKKSLSSLSKGELEGLPPELLARPDVLAALSDKQREILADSKERTVAEKDMVRQSSPVGLVEQTFNDPALGGPLGASAMLRSLTPAQVAKLPKNILIDRNIVGEFTPAVLTALQEEKKLSTREIAAITAHITGGVGPASLRAYIAGVGSAYWT